MHPFRHTPPRPAMLHAVASAVFCALTLLAQASGTSGGRPIGTRNALQLLDAKPGKAVARLTATVATPYA